MKRKYLFIILYGVFVIGAVFRLYHINWDSNFHMHPDERAIILTVLKLEYPHSLSEFLSPSSSWNTHFFAYGSLPFYLLKTLSSISPYLQTYDGLTILGRYLSSFFDLGTLVVLFFIGRKIKNTFVGLTASFLYAISVLPIQLSHFYAVDTPLTFFISCSILLLLNIQEKVSIKKSVILGIIIALALATKISAVVLLLPVGFVLFLPVIELLKKDHKTHHNQTLQMIAIGTVFFGVTTLICYFLFEPYAFLDFQSFLTQTQDQQAMTKSAFTFPYTLQYVGKIPYLYEIKNIFFFGLGIPLAVICFVGVISALLLFIKHKHWNEKKQYLLLFSFILPYFAVVGHFAVGFMRYMLPVYPFLCLFGALLLSSGESKLARWHLRYILYILLFTILLIWPLSFMHIYTVPNTRIQATTWILSHIPQGKTLAIEHWDDAIPIHDQENYNMVTLTLYDPDTPEKWQMITSELSQSDYIILASNRLYVPLQKLTDCAKLPPDRCYPQTAAYYKALFSGSLGFKKVADFTVSPKIPFTHISIDDQAADESFTVYDHPRVQIFQKSSL